MGVIPDGGEIDPIERSTALVGDIVVAGARSDSSDRTMCPNPGPAPNPVGVEARTPAIGDTSAQWGLKYLANK